MDNLTELFCHVDDFCQQFEPEFRRYLLENGKTRHRSCCVELSEIMTLLILFHQLRYRQFKMFYLYHVCGFMRDAFPTLPSYNRFVELMPRAIIPMCCYLEKLKGQCSGISYIDSTKISVCHNKRIKQHKVFDGIAQRGKSSTGWFFGFKLHLVINHLGEIVDVTLTPGNTDDRKVVKQLSRHLHGKLFGDKGYISAELQTWLSHHLDLSLITKQRKNMRKKALDKVDETLLKSRGLIETVIDELKNLCQIAHSRHRSYHGFMINLLSGLVAYCWFPDKPKLSGVKFNHQLRS